MCASDRNHSAFQEDPIEELSKKHLSKSLHRTVQVEQSVLGVDQLVVSGHLQMLLSIVLNFVSFSAWAISDQPSI